MGLKLTLNAENNSMGHPFVDAYWVVENLKYEMKDKLSIEFDLNCYPTRESSKMTGQKVVPMEYMEPTNTKVNGKLCGMHHLNFAVAIFPEGIPMERDEQLTIIYTFIKAYTGLPFEDVLEGEQTEDGETDETEEEPTEELTEDSVAEEPSEEEVPGDEADEIEESDEDTDEDVTEESASEEEGEKENG